MLSVSFIIGFLLAFISYGSINLALYLYLYSSTKLCKIQRNQHHSSFSAPGHWWIGPFNAFQAAVFGGFVFEYVYSGNSKVYWNWSEIQWIQSLLLPSIVQGIAEYVWHRIMHLPWFYKTFHKIHHFYKSPQRN